MSFLAQPLGNVVKPDVNKAVQSQTSQLNQAFLSALTHLENSKLVKPGQELFDTAKTNQT